MAERLSLRPHRISEMPEICVLHGRARTPDHQGIQTTLCRFCHGNLHIGRYHRQWKSGDTDNVHISSYPSHWFGLSHHVCATGKTKHLFQSQQWWGGPSFCLRLSIAAISERCMSHPIPAPLSLLLIKWSLVRAPNVRLHEDGSVLDLHG